jgi:hypothetical protein
VRNTFLGGKFGENKKICLERSPIVVMPVLSDSKKEDGHF